MVEIVKVKEKHYSQRKKKKKKL